CKLALRQDNVIKVDWINYTLHTGAGTNVAASNADELSERFDEVNELCAKSRSKVPAGVMKLLSIPFDLEELVPIIRPDTLAVLSASRQHVFE
ncbi:hypothetical protein JG688_00004762, partial [Phytophthora aleatoria]